MTDRQILVPDLAVLLDVAGKRACKLHGCVKTPGYVFGSARIVNETDRVRLARISDSDPTGLAYDTLSFQAEIYDDTYHQANESGLDGVVYAGGFIWMLSVISPPINDAFSTLEIALIRVDPNTLEYTIFQFERTVVSSIEIFVFCLSVLGTDGEYLYTVNCSGFPGEDVNGPIRGLYRWKVSDQSFTLLGNASFEEFGTMADPHSIHVDNDYVWANLSTGVDPLHLIKVDKRTGELLDRVLIPRGTDDMAQWTSPLTGEGWIFIGHEFVNTSEFGFPWAAISAIRKSDMAMFTLPPYWLTKDVSYENSISVSAFGNYLIDTRSDKHIYAINLLEHDPSTWHEELTDLELEEIITKDFTITFPPAFESSVRTPGEVMRDENGLFHILVWPNPLVDEPPGSDATNGFIRLTLPGITLSPPVITTLYPTSTEDGTLLRGYVDQPATNGAITETGFYFDSFSPPTTEYRSDFDAQFGEFTKELEVIPGTYYIQAFCKSSQGDVLGEIIEVQVPLTTSRGFTGFCRLDTINGPPMAGVSVYIMDTVHQKIKAVVTSDSTGRFTINQDLLIDMLRPERTYTLFAVHPGTNRRSLSKVSQPAFAFDE